MKNIKPDSNVMVTTQEIDILSHEKAYVRMSAGCVWSYLLQDGVRVGVAFAGPSRFAVDAIAETDMGAMGESITGDLAGIQLFIGSTSLENISKNAESSDILNQGFSNPEAFTKEIESTVTEHLNGTNKKITIESKKDSKLLFGTDSNNKTILLVLSEEKGLVLTYGKSVFVLGDDNFVSVSKSGVVVSNKEGKQIIIGKEGIVGLDSFIDVGPIITRSVAGAMQGLRGLKSLKSMKQTMRGTMSSRGWVDNVDDFDWED
ncbi:MAG: hypothetical protein ThorAB25_19850 [Candidatus Thorarchaeota archaeon AB_25]|nr:MAG: hypothetical protein ThorAB25_19850 [Candidatus Thorarchaeota archaeon AB_25]